MDEDLKILTKEEVREKLKEFPGWKYNDDKISKQFNFAKFSDVLKLINELASYCEKIDHHPDIHIFYKKVLFELQRFSAGGKVTERDFLVAAKIERLYENYQLLADKKS